MSIKTLRKRIALVAVSTLGVGLLSVAPANAADAVAANMTIATAAANVSTFGVCAAGTDTTAQDSSTPIVMQVGGRHEFTLATNGESYMRVSSGSAKWVNVRSGQTFENTAQTLIKTSSTGVSVAEFTGAGSVTIQLLDYTDYTNGTTTVVKTWYFSVVPSCTVGVSAATSFVQVSDSSTGVDTAANWLTRQTATTQTSAGTFMTSASTLDTSLDVRTNFSNGQEAYIAVRARDAYTINITGSLNLLTIVCDNGARVNGTEYNFFSDASWNASTYNEGNISVSQPTDNVAASSTCTVSVNGVELAKKTIKWAGDLASITLGASRIGEVGTSTVGRFTYTCKDAAGNSLSCADATTSNNHTGISNLTLTSGVGGTVVTSIAEAASSSTYFGQSFGFGANPYTVGAGLMNYTCSDYGKKNISIYAYSAAGAKVTSNALEVICEDAAVHTWTASLDKATYKKGDVATLTITAKGSGGETVAYGTTPGTGYSVAMPGMTAVVAPSTVDTETVARSGTWVYTYTVNSDAEGSYNGAVRIVVGSTSPQYTKAVTVPYTVSGTGAVSNAEVLAAIVKLIASINKQIRALQKSLRR
jgi:hypothetical protein